MTWQLFVPLAHQAHILVTSMMGCYCYITSIPFLWCHWFLIGLFVPHGQNIAIWLVRDCSLLFIPDVYKTWTQVHGPPPWTRSMDHPVDRGPGPWTRSMDHSHGPSPWTTPWPDFHHTCSCTIYMWVPQYGGFRAENNSRTLDIGRPQFANVQWNSNTGWSGCTRYFASHHNNDRLVCSVVLQWLFEN